MLIPEMGELCAEKLWHSLRGPPVSEIRCNRAAWHCQAIGPQHHCHMRQRSLAPCGTAPVHQHTTTARCLRTSASLPRDTRAVLPADAL